MQAPPERGGANRIVTATGVVGPAATEAVAARASGEIQALNCDANMRVKAGQLCAKIDPAPYQIAIDRYRAELTAANAQFEKDKADLAQAKAAFQKKEGRSKHSDMRLAVDKLRSAFERAQAQTEQDETAVAELRATLHAAETNLGYTDIVAPIDGTVVSRNVEKGQRVTAGSEKPLFVFAADLTSARIDAMVSAKGRADIKLGDQVTFTVEALPNHSFTGAVTQIHPIFEASEHAAAYDVVITAPNEDLLLKPGMAATTMIVIE
ncbi:efflux RND transporter periplasmic adaptor subunit [Methylocapsa acidiphila]|uniref:efflux RND transporter periplasmic adaptor subunit n=1 Tax=Methylocapsa acidiphila TaxID=133552 RepID=UPI001FD8AAB3|nr:efflux RND transporter periplasmic adaptor subunit [Methylocapsa acidiphila]